MIYEVIGILCSLPLPRIRILIHVFIFCFNLQYLLDDSPPRYMLADSTVTATVVTATVVVCVAKDSEVLVRAVYCFNKGEIISDSDERSSFAGWNIMLTEN